ncbi:MAG: ATP-binding protein [Bacteroidales bacterium]|nr:ATP-binding protein [Bacteroidales bacterium]
MENTGKHKIRIIFTGPESTAKTALSRQMADYFKAVCVEEYAREYILGLDRHYNYDDVKRIAEMQRSQMNAFLGSGERLAFFDTYLIITRIWFEVAFGKAPEWVDREIAMTGDALYLLCRPDIPWEPDPLRENGGEMREKLFIRYEEELKHHGLRYAYLEGTGSERTKNALHHITTFLKANG